MITQNDYNILEAIIDKDDKQKGTIQIKGTTKKEIISKTNLSMTKVNTTLYKFLSEGLIEKGLSIKNAQTYILTKKGLAEYIKLKGVDVEC